MAKGAFLKCHEVTAKWEGGWSDHPSDPGGATMYGITIAKYREHFPKGTAADLKKISRAAALDIYRKDFWNTVNGDNLAPGVDLAVYDAGVNSGVSRARKWLLASIGGADVQTVKNICKARLGFVQGLSTWKTFGKGWARRIADIEAKGVSWALAAVTTPGVVKQTLDREAKEANTKSDNQTVAAGTTTAGTAGGAAVSPEIVDQAFNTQLIVFLSIMALIAAALFWRAHIHKARSLAYATEAARV